MFKVVRRAFNIKYDGSGQKQTWNKNGNKFFDQTTTAPAPYLHSQRSRNNNHGEGKIEYQQGVTIGNNNGCHVMVGGKKFKRKCRHGQSTPILNVRIQYTKSCILRIKTSKLYLVLSHSHFCFIVKAFVFV